MRPSSWAFMFTALVCTSCDDEPTGDHETQGEPIDLDAITDLSYLAFQKISVTWFGPIEDRVWCSGEFATTEWCDGYTSCSMNSCPSRSLAELEGPDAMTEIFRLEDQAANVSWAFMISNYGRNPVPALVEFGHNEANFTLSGSERCVIIRHDGESGESNWVLECSTESVCGTSAVD